MIIVRVDRDALHNVQRTLNVTNKAVQVAGTRAIKKTLRWIASRGSRQIAKQHAVPVKALRSRVRLSQPTGRSEVGLAWFGVDDLPAINASAKQRATGVKAGGHFFQSAFIASVYGPLNVFKRKGRERFPVIVQKIPLDGAEETLNAIAAAAPDRLRELFLQELNYATNVEGT